MGDIARQRMNLGAYGAGAGLLLTLPLLPGEDQAAPLVGVNPLIAVGALGTAGAFAPELRDAYYQSGAGTRPDNVPDPVWYSWQNMGPYWRSEYKSEYGGNGFDGFYDGYKENNSAEYVARWYPINWETATPREKATAGRIIGQAWRESMESTQRYRRNNPI